MPLPTAPEPTAPATPAASSPATPPPRVFAVTAKDGIETARYTDDGLVAEVTGRVDGTRRAWSVFLASAPTEVFGRGSAPTASSARASALGTFDDAFAHNIGRVAPAAPNADRRAGGSPPPSRA